jgi:hypothetical protein
VGAALAIMTGCQPQNRLKLKYYPGESNGNVFEASRVAVMPAGDTSVTQLAVGKLFDPDGNEATLILDDPSKAVSRLVAEDLDHKGLRAKVFASPAEVPDGYDHVASCEPEELSVVKRIDQAKEPGENSFLMKAKARIRCTLADRDGKVILNDSFSSTRNEPPLGEAAQHHRRLINDPGEALSAAISDAVDDFTSHPDFRGVLPAKIASSDLPAIASSASPSATPSSTSTGPNPTSTNNSSPAPTPGTKAAAPTPSPAHH